MNNGARVPMNGFLRAPKYFLILSLMLFSPKILADPPQSTRKLDFSCMDRVVKEKIANCFEEKNACEISLKSASSQRPYVEIVLAILAGFAAGVVIDKSVRF